MGSSSDSKSGFLFTIEVLVEGQTNGKALETLLSVLNTEAVRDYRVKSGVNLGRLIELNTDKPKDAQQAPDAGKKTEKEKTPAPPKGKDKQESEPAKSGEPNEKMVIDMIKRSISTNSLVRLSVVKGKGIKLSLPCRILNWDETSETVTVYHVDEKKVYLLKLNEIDDFHTT